jgi:hypothetical protein
MLIMWELQLFLSYGPEIKSISSSIIINLIIPMNYYSYYYLIDRKADLILENQQDQVNGYSCLADHY